MVGSDRLELRFIRQIEPKWSERDPSLFSRPPIGTRFSPLDRRHRKPEQIAAQGMLRRNDMAVIPTHGGAGPDESSGLAREIDVDEGQRRFVEQDVEHAPDPRLRTLKVLEAGWTAQRYAPH